MRFANILVPVIVALIYSALFLFVECGNQAKAREALLPADQWNPVTRLWTARAGVAEVGWHRGAKMPEAKRQAKRAEQLAVWWVLRARWVRMQERYPTMRFQDVLRAYCAGLGSRREPTPRQRWIRALTLDGTEPLGWPRHASWSRHRELWRETLERAERWANNRTGSNPCPGAVHFGGLRAGDKPRGRMVRHRCSDRFERYRGSTFYLVVKKKGNRSYATHRAR